MSDITKIILGNLFSVGAMITDSISGTRKTNKSILLMQSGTQIFYALSSIMFNTYSALVQNVVAIFRNIYAALGKKKKIMIYLFVILSFVLGILFNNQRVWGLIPVISNLEYSVAMFIFPDEPKKLKYAFILNCSLFAIFNFYILNFVGGISCVIVIITTVISIYKENTKEKK